MSKCASCGGAAMTAGFAHLYGCHYMLGNGAYLTGGAPIPAAAPEGVRTDNSAVIAKQSEKIQRLTRENEAMRNTFQQIADCEICHVQFCGYHGARLASFASIPPTPETPK